MPNKPGTPPNTSAILNDAELEFVSRYFSGGKSESIHRALEALMGTVEMIHEQWGWGVAQIAALAGATGIRELGSGYSNGRKGEPDYHVTFFELLGDGPKFPIRGATTNATPVWEDEDSAAFAELADECGVEL